MAINRLQNRTQFSQYCLRKLGQPVTQVNVAAVQVDDCINDALDKFWEYHADGSTQFFMKHQITQDDLDRGYFEIEPGILNVLQVLSTGGESTGIANLNNLEYFAYFSDLISKIPIQGISTYLINIQYLNNIQETFNAQDQIEYNKHQGRLSFISGREKLKVDDWIVYEVVKINDPDDFPETWNNWWLKAYTVAQIKKQWGVNLGKYQGVTLPSGITLNGEAIRQEAVAEIEQLEQRLRDEFQLPPDMMVG